MKCNIKKHKAKCAGLSIYKSCDEDILNLSKLNLKSEQPESIDLNDHLFHGIGTYLEPHQKIGRLRAILDSKAILCENSQPETFEFANYLSRSPKCNGKFKISVCQRQSFIDQKNISESFNMFISNGISIILDKDIIESLNAENKFNPMDGYMGVA